MPERPENLRGVKWNNFEISLLNTYYEKFGPRRVLEELAAKGYRRDIDAITRKAKRRRLYYDPIPEGYVALTSVHPSWDSEAAGASVAALRRAREDGVLRTVSKRGRIHVVPEEWADAYLEELSQKLDVERECRPTWLTTEQAARLFGVSDAYLGFARRRPHKYPTMADMVAPIERREGIVAIYWEPTATKIAALRYKRWRLDKKARPPTGKNEPSLRTPQPSGDRQR